MATNHDFAQSNPTPYQVRVLELPATIAVKKPFQDKNITSPPEGNISPFMPFPDTSILWVRENVPLEILEWQNPSALNLYWFRWVLSHHIIFLCWHKIASHILQLQYLQSPPLYKTLGEVCISLIKLCSLMLLYAASCPNILYKRYIRTFMALYYKGFTAKWSLEYQAYKLTMEQLLANPLLGDLNATLRAAYYEHKMVHMAVAQKFLGHAPSLLKMEENSALGILTPATQFIYDSFFLVKRIDYYTVNMKDTFLERITQAHADLACNPFFPNGRIPLIFKKQKKITALLVQQEMILKNAYPAFSHPLVPTS